MTQTSLQRRGARYEGSVLCIVLLCVLVGCALSLVTSRHEARRLTVELSREQQRARQFDIEYGQLSLEQSTWGMPARVEKIARETLRMQLPAPSRVEIVEAGSAP
jgi:cell division protein FtsL